MAQLDLSEHRRQLFALGAELSESDAPRVRFAYRGRRLAPVGGLAREWLVETPEPGIGPEARALAAHWHLAAPSAPMPLELFSWESLATARGILLMVVGGFLVGFGARWANGCTSGHAIMGLSLLRPASLVAVLGFFAGGLIVSWFVLPWVLR